MLRASNPLKPQRRHPLVCLNFPIPRFQLKIEYSILNDLSNLEDSASEIACRGYESHGDGIVFVELQTWAFPTRALHCLRSVCTI